MLEAIRKLFKLIHSREQQSQAEFQSALKQAKALLLQVALEGVPSALDDQGKELKREAQNLANRIS